MKILLLPAVIYAALVIGFILCHTLAFDTEPWLVPLGVAGSFAFYFYVTLLLLHLIGPAFVPPNLRSRVAAALPLAILLLLTLTDLAGISSSQGFLRIDGRAIWMLPGILFHSAYQRITFLPPTAEAHVTSNSRRLVFVEGALPQSDGSIVFLGKLRRKGYPDTWRLIGRVDGSGVIDQSFSPTPRELPWLDFLGGNPDGTALVIQPDMGNRLSRLLPTGALQELLRIPDMPGGIYLGTTRQVAIDAQGRYLIAGPAIRDLSSAKPTYAPVLRLKPNGDLDPTFAPPYGPILHGSPRILASPGDRILLLTDEMDDRETGLLRLNADGSVDQQFATTLKTALDTLHFGRVRDAAVDPQGRLVLVLQPELYQPALLALLDGTELRKVPLDIRRPVTSLDLHPDGSVLLTTGNDPAHADWPPVLLRFDRDLRPLPTPTLTKETYVRVLTPLPDSGFLLALLEKEQASRVIYLNRDGVITRTIPF